MRLLKSLLSFVLGLTLVAGAADAQTIQAKTKRPIPRGYIVSPLPQNFEPMGWNDNGKVCGFVNVPGVSKTTPYGAICELKHDLYVFTYIANVPSMLFDINNVGEAVGVRIIASPADKGDLKIGILVAPSGQVDLPTGLIPYYINDSRQIAGDVEEQEATVQGGFAQQRVFRFSRNGDASILPIENAMTRDITKTGDVIVTRYDGDAPSGLIWKSSGETQDLGIGYAFAATGDGSKIVGETGLLRKDEFAGEYLDQSRATTWEVKTGRKKILLGKNSTAYGISDDGRIVGQNRGRAYLLTENGTYIDLTLKVRSRLPRYATLFSADAINNAHQILVQIELKGGGFLSDRYVVAVLTPIW